MKVWSPIFNLIAVVIAFLVALTFINISRTFEKDFNQERYNYAVRQATEAMFRSTLQSEDIDTDYKDIAYIQINSSDALNVFDRVMCANYNLSPSKENYETINNSIAACAIGGFDGYYILETSKDDSIEQNGVAFDGYSQRFSTKIPYILDGGIGSANIYAIDIYHLTYATMAKTAFSYSPTINVVGGSYPPGFDEALVTKSINRQVRASLINELSNKNKAKSVEIERLRLVFPDELTDSGVNPFSTPGIFLMMSGTDFANTEGLVALGVSGFKAIKRNRVIGFTETLPNGEIRAYYCYEGQLRDTEKDADSGGISLAGTSSKFHVVNFYKNMREAAEAVDQTSGKHYVPYYEILTRKITLD